MCPGMCSGCHGRSSGAWGSPITLPFGQLPTGRSLQDISLKREMLSASKDQTLTGLINPEDVKSHQTHLS